ncbi:hypothetical protein B0A50_01509 [Salinomyces thailandicus]|uniref:Cytochrome P450 n=1 Tax=Salinomyces thailandicus TaxID=706561 RepID=A0A4U0UAI1_9PEZI|nr:hypothetical protein B0A50_01509 [Salinomyces thailandica]
MPEINSSTLAFVVTLLEAAGVRYGKLDIARVSRNTLVNGDYLPYIAIFATNFLLWVTWRLIYTTFLNPLRNLPSPPNGSIFTGHGAAVFGKPPGVELHSWVESVPNDGIIYFRSYLNQDSLLLTGPRAFADVLQRNCYDFEKPPQLRTFLGRVQGDGLSVVEGGQHKFQRKILNPAFHIRHIKDLYPLFWEKGHVLVDALERSLTAGRSSGVVEMTEWASRVSMDIIGVAALGKEFGTLSDPEHPIMLQFKELFEFTTEGAVYFALSMVLPQSLIEWSPFFKKPKETMGPGVQRLRKAGHGMLEEKKARRVSEDVDILSVILRSESFPDENLVDQLITFLAAGHETTANALTWACHLLATHQTTQTSLREEIRTAGLLPTAEVNAAKFEALPLLNGVINEALRLFPGAPILLRECVRASTIQGQYVPRGTQVILCPWAINRSQQLWGERASEFVPERWIDTNDEGTSKPNNHGGAESNYSFLTFLQGPRRCIGENFSRAELRCLICALVGKFKIEMANPEEKIVTAGIVGLKARDGMHLRLTPLLNPEALSS